MTQLAFVVETQMAQKIKSTLKQLLYCWLYSEENRISYVQGFSCSLIFVISLASFKIPRLILSRHTQGLASGASFVVLRFHVG